MCPPRVEYEYSPIIDKWGATKERTFPQFAPLFIARDTPLLFSIPTIWEPVAGKLENGYYSARSPWRIAVLVVLARFFP